MLALGGAELILVPNACELEANRLGQVRARAFENMAAVAVANYAAPQENGHSTVVDPIAFDAEGRSRDTRVFEAGEAEEVCVVRLDLGALREWRRREVWGSECRRPETYGALVEDAAATSPPDLAVDGAGRSGCRARRVPRRALTSTWRRRSIRLARSPDGPRAARSAPAAPLRCRYGLSRRSCPRRPCRCPATSPSRRSSRRSSRRGPRSARPWGRGRRTRRRGSPRRRAARCRRALRTSVSIL